MRDSITKILGPVLLGIFVFTIIVWSAGCASQKAAKLKPANTEATEDAKQIVDVITYISNMCRSESAIRR